MSTPGSPDSLDTVVAVFAKNAVLMVASVGSFLLTLLPASVSNALTSLLSSVQTLLQERWEWRAVAILLTLPSALFLLLVGSIAAALLWPFAFPIATIAGLATASFWLFFPSSSQLSTCLLSLAFAVGSQLLLALPVYFLAPFSLFAVLVAAAAYLFSTGSWLLLVVTGWWLLTTPYWSLLHFLSFPFLFIAGLCAQLALALTATIACALYPSLPDTLLRYYHDYYQQRSAEGRLKAGRGSAASASSSREGRAGGADQAKHVDDWPVKDEAKQQQPHH